MRCCDGQSGGRGDGELRHRAREEAVDRNVAACRRLRHPPAWPVPRARAARCPRRSLRPSAGPRAAPGRESRRRAVRSEQRRGRVRRPRRARPRRSCSSSRRRLECPCTTRSVTIAFSISVGWCTSEPANRASPECSTCATASASPSTTSSAAFATSIAFTNELRPARPGIVPAPRRARRARSDQAGLCRSSSSRTGATSRVRRPRRACPRTSA